MKKKKNSNKVEIATREEPDDVKRELTVCDIIGEWGAYQFSVTLFGVVYSAITSTTIVVGPIWTPEMRHVCAPLPSASGYNSTGFTAGLIDFASNPHQCNQVVTGEVGSDNQAGDRLFVECERFIYDDQQFGRLLTNTFDLVCNRQWLRSTLSSAALTGMLISSVTLGLLSDRYGRLCCIQTGFVIAIISTIGAILARNYLVLNVCFMLMSLAQVGVANALSTLVMESTSPRYRFVSVFEYGFGWGLGLLVVPLLNSITRDYKHFLLASLIVQLSMLFWCRLGVFESIRWLLSEGKINRAQIELRRACRMNRIKNGAELAQRIASVQASQVRKASKLIESKIGQQDGLLSQAVRQSFLLFPFDRKSPNSDENQSTGGSVKMSISESLNNATLVDIGNSNPEPTGKDRSNSVISPTLAKKSFSISNQAASNQYSAGQFEMVNLNANSSEKPIDLITNQAAVQLVLQYSKTLQEHDDGTFFLTLMFHKKLWKTTVILAIISIMAETSYYGLIQASGIVGDDIEFNYAIGALSEWVAAVLFVLTLLLLSRRAALIVPLFLSSIACLGMATTYYLIPNSPLKTAPLNETLVIDMSDGQIILSETASTIANQSILLNETHNASENFAGQEYQMLIDLREKINVGLMTFGKLTVTVVIQVAATITMESYPNNLRQSGAGVILIAGRACSILAPFLFGDHSSEKLILQITLTALGVFGFLICIVVPLFLRETKGQELCDRLNEIGEEDNEDT